MVRAMGGAANPRGIEATMREAGRVAEAGQHAAAAWTAPVVRVHSIVELTRLGFNTNCDGGFGLNAIDGSAFGCNR